MAKKREPATQPPASRPGASSVDRQQEIAQRANELHVARGYRQGHDLEDWLDAEREVGAAV